MGSRVSLNRRQRTSVTQWKWLEVRTATPIDYEETCNAKLRTSSTLFVFNVRLGDSTGTVSANGVLTVGAAISS